MKQTYAIVALCALAAAVLASRHGQGASAIPALHGGFPSVAVMSFALAAIIDPRS